MQINRIQSDNTSFGIKVSQNFIKAAHNHYNYNVGTNKKQNIYNFNSMVEKFKTFGHNDYTLDYERKNNSGNWNHYLFVIKDDGTDRRNITVRNTLLKIINNFMGMNRSEFNAKFHRNH